MRSTDPDVDAGQREIVLGQTLAQPGRAPAVGVREDERERCGRGEQENVGERARPGAAGRRLLDSYHLGHAGER